MEPLHLDPLQPGGPTIQATIELDYKLSYENLRRPIFIHSLYTMLFFFSLIIVIFCSD